MTAAGSCKAERLAVAGQVAPALRANVGEAKARRVAITDADGNVVGYRTLADVQTALLERQSIEIQVDDGVRPKTVMCGVCGKPKAVPVRGRYSANHEECTWAPCAANCGARARPGSLHCRDCLGEALEPVQFTDDQRVLIAQRTSAAMGLKRVRGEYTGGAAPYGFAVDCDGKLVASESEQAVVCEAKGMRAAGASLRSIAVHLEAKGVKSRAGRRFDAKQIARMLAGDKLTGFGK